MASLPYYLIAYPADGSRALIREVAGADVQAKAAAVFATGKYARVQIARVFQEMRSPQGENADARP